MTKQFKITYDGIDMEYNLTDMQTQFIESNRKLKVITGEVGCGKSYVAMLAILQHALKNPGSLNAVVMSTNSSIRNIALVLIEELLPKSLIASSDLFDNDMTLVNGSRIIFRSAYNETSIQNLRGLTLASFWIDDASLMNESIWNVLIGRLRQRDMSYLGIVTSDTKENWTYTRFVLRELSDEFLLLKDIPTSSNTFLPEEYIKTLED